MSSRYTRAPQKSMSELVEDITEAFTEDEGEVATARRALKQIANCVAQQDGLQNPAVKGALYDLVGGLGSGGLARGSPLVQGVTDLIDDALKRAPNDVDLRNNIAGKAAGLLKNNRARMDTPLYAKLNEWKNLRVPDRKSHGSILRRFSIRRGPSKTRASSTSSPTPLPSLTRMKSTRSDRFTAEVPSPSLSSTELGGSGSNYISSPGYTLALNLIYRDSEEAGASALGKLEKLVSQPGSTDDPNVQRALTRLVEGLGGDKLKSGPIVDGVIALIDLAFNNAKPDSALRKDIAEGAYRALRSNNPPAGFRVHERLSYWSGVPSQTQRSSIRQRTPTTRTDARTSPPQPLSGARLQLAVSLAKNTGADGDYVVKLVQSNPKANEGALVAYLTDPSNNIPRAGRQSSAQDDRGRLATQYTRERPLTLPSARMKLAEGLAEATGLDRDYVVDFVRRYPAVQEGALFDYLFNHASELPQAARTPSRKDVGKDLADQIAERHPDANLDKEYAAALYEANKAMTPEHLEEIVIQKADRYSALNKDEKVIVDKVVSDHGVDPELVAMVVKENKGIGPNRLKTIFGQTGTEPPPSPYETLDTDQRALADHIFAVNNTIDPELVVMAIKQKPDITREELLEIFGLPKTNAR